MLSSPLIVTVLLNGAPIDFGQVPAPLKPSLRDGVVMVPARPVLEAIGAKVDYGSTAGARKNYYEAYVTYKGKEVSLRDEYALFSIAQERVHWPLKLKRKAPKPYLASAFAPSPFYGGKVGQVARVMMPLGFLSATFDFSIHWDEKKRVANITLASSRPPSLW